MLNTVLSLMAKQVKFSNEVDRISRLPDDLLCHIISFLPLKEAVCTSILSTRWHKISTFMSNLNIRESFKQRLNKSEICKFVNFVDRVLLYHIGDVYKFRISCGGFIDSYKVDGWIRYALLKNVRELDLYLGIKFNVLPMVQVFTCHTLVALRLSFTLGRHDLKVPDKICLPRVEILHLSHIGLLDDDSIYRLFSNSVIQELVLDRCILKTRCRFNAFNISIPTLKRLTLTWNGKFFCDSEVMIDAPNLVYFKCGQRTKGLLLKNLNPFVETHIDFDTVFNSYNTFSSDLFRHICNVESLCLYGRYPKFSLQEKLPKVTYLDLRSCFDVQWLPNLLVCFPCIKNIKINIVYNSEDSQPQKRLPSLPFSQLKTIKISSFRSEETGMKMVEFFLKNAIVLENCSIEIEASTRLKKEKLRSKVANKLLKLPKASKNCKVLVV